MDAGLFFRGFDALPMIESAEEDAGNSSGDSMVSDLEAGLHCLPPKTAGVKQARTSIHLKHSRGFSQYMHQCKRLKATETSLKQNTEESTALKDAWNHRSLRLGDQVRDETRPGGNRTFTAAGILKVAWRSAGKSTNERDGIEGTHRVHSMVATSASVISSCQDRVVSDEISGLRSLHAVPFCLKWYDGTPISVKFGRLQEELMPYARYPVMDPDTKEWKSVGDLEITKRLGPGRLPSFGTVELMVRGGCMHFMCPTSRQIQGIRVFAKPAVLQHGGASCIYRGTEDSIPAFSAEGLSSICEEVPFLFYCELPDGHSANARKQEKTRAALPSNCGMLTAKCGSHQAHRILASREKLIVGDVHACFVMSSHGGNQNRMQKAARTLVDKMEYNVGYPHPSFEHYNASILLRTVLRRRAFIQGGIDLSKASIHDHPLAVKFLVLLNGDWTKPRISFYTAGRNIGPQEAKELIFSAIIEMDILQANAKEPSIDDWFSAAEGAGKCSLGILCHEILGQVCTLAFPLWDSMGQGDASNTAADPESVDGATLSRMRVQTKTWRARLALLDKDRRIAIVVLSILGIAVEHLMQRRDYLGERKKGLFDMPFPMMNPFATCQQFLHHALSQGFKAGAPLEPVYKHFSDGTTGETNLLLSYIRGIGLDMGSQCFWRFMNLRELPFTLVDAVNPGLAHERQVASIKKPFLENACCHDRDCTGKLVGVYGTWQKACADTRLMEGLRCVGTHFPFVNMISERLLALIGKAVGCRGQKPEIESVASKGFLAMLLTEHRHLGGTNPRIVTRGQLLAAGVPLACAESNKENQQCGTFVHWLGKQNKKRKEARHMLTRSGYNDFLANLRLQWESMGDEGKDRVLQETRMAHAERSGGTEMAKKDNSELDAIASARKGCVQSVVSLCMSNESPIDTHWFEQAVKSELDMHPEDPMPGFVAYGEHFRKKQLQSCFVRDMQDIPKDQQFSYTLPCCLAHPRLCATDHQAIMPSVMACVKQIRSHLKGVRTGDPLVLIWSSDSDETRTYRGFMLAHLRFANPHIALLAESSFSFDGTGVFQAKSAEGAFIWHMDVSVAGDVFREHGDAVRIWMTTLRINTRVCYPSAHKYAVDMAECRRAIANPIQVYPVVASGLPSAAPSADTRYIQQGLRALPREDVGKRKANKQMGVKLCMPKGPDGPGDDDDGEEIGSCSSEASSSAKKSQKKMRKKIWRKKTWRKKWSDLLLPELQGETGELRRMGGCMLNCLREVNLLACHCNAECAGSVRIWGTPLVAWSVLRPGGDC